MRAGYLVLVFFLSTLSIAGADEKTLMECNRHLGDKFSRGFRQELSVPNLGKDRSVVLLVELPASLENPQIRNEFFFQFVSALKDLGLEIGKTDATNDGRIYMNVKGKLTAIVKAAERGDVAWVGFKRKAIAETVPPSAPSSQPPSVSDYADKVLQALRTDNGYVDGFNQLSLKEIKGKKSIVIYVENVAAIKRIERLLVKFGVPLVFEVQSAAEAQSGNISVVRPRLLEELDVLEELEKHGNAGRDGELGVSFGFQTFAQKFEFLTVVHGFEKVRTGTLDRPDSKTFVLFVYAKPATIRGLLERLPKGIRWVDLLEPKKLAH